MVGKKAIISHDDGYSSTTGIIGKTGSISTQIASGIQQAQSAGEP
jgi:hypothetical protein